MLNHSLSNSSLWNTNISFQISISSFLREGSMTYAVSCQTLRLGRTWSPLGPQDLACALDGSALWSGEVRPHLTVRHWELLLETGYRYLGWVFKYTAPIIALPWTCRFYRSSAVPLITSASPHRGFRDSQSLRQAMAYRNMFTYSSLSVSLPLAITSEPRLYHTGPREFSQGFVASMTQFPWNDATCHTVSKL